MERAVERADFARRGDHRRRMTADLHRTDQKTPPARAWQAPRPIRVQQSPASSLACQQRRCRRDPLRPRRAPAGRAGRTACDQLLPDRCRGGGVARRHHRLNPLLIRRDRFRRQWFVSEPQVIPVLCPQEGCGEAGEACHESENILLVAIFLVMGCCKRPGNGGISKFTARRHQKIRSVCEIRRSFGECRLRWADRAGFTPPVLTTSEYTWRSIGTGFDGNRTKP